MTAYKLQEAIALIKGGDKQAGQRLLTEVLNADPKNETAWLWMSALVTGDKRRFCLEKVLNINPNHPQAREQLAKLTASPLAGVQPAAPAGAMVSAPQSLQAEVHPAPVPEVAQVASSTPVQGTPLPKVWLFPKKYFSTIICLEGNTLLAFDAPSEKASDVLEEIRQGVTPKQLDQLKKKFQLMSVNHVSLARTSSVTLFSDTLKVVTTDNSGNEKNLNLTLDKENVEAIFKAVQERLGSGFQKVTRPISRLRVLMSAILLFVLTICGTGFCYWFVQGLQRDVASGASIPRRVGVWVALLMLIGPNGFLCIGGILLIAGIAVMVSSLAKPPEETVLTRVVGSENSH